MATVSFVLRGMEDKDQILLFWDNLVNAMKEAVGLLLTSVTCVPNTDHCYKVISNSTPFHVTLDWTTYKYPVIAFTCLSPLSGAFGGRTGETAVPSERNVLSIGRTAADVQETVISILTPCFPQLNNVPSTGFVVVSAAVPLDILAVCLTRECPRVHMGNEAIPPWVRFGLANASTEHPDFVCLSIGGFRNCVRSAGLLKNADRYYLRRRRVFYRCGDYDQQEKIDDYL
jgi:hypothetical protein